MPFDTIEDLLKSKKPKDPNDPDAPDEDEDAIKPFGNHAVDSLTGNQYLVVVEPFQDFVLP